MKDKTLDYYNQNAENFIQGTVNVDFTSTQERFLEKLPFGASILDFGCGSGRDTKYFLDKGFCVDAIDGSEELCRFASAYAGVFVHQMMFQDLKEEDRYDGIWACSSILHLPKEDLKEVMVKIERALKKGGILYTSFKYGDFEGERNGRYFTDFTESSFQEFVKDMVHLSLLEYWITEDVRPERNEKWLNVLMRRK